MAVLRRFARFSGGLRGNKRGSALLAAVAALSASILALPAPAQAGLFGGGTSEYIVSAPSGTVGTAISAVRGVGAWVGTTLSFDDAVTSQLELDPGRAPRRRARHRRHTRHHGEPAGVDRSVLAARRRTSTRSSPGHRSCGHRATPGRESTWPSSTPASRRCRTSRAGSSTASTSREGESLAGQLRARHVRRRADRRQRRIVERRLRGRGAGRRPGLGEGRRGEWADRSGHGDPGRRLDHRQRGEGQHRCPEHVPGLPADRVHRDRPARPGRREGLGCRHHRRHLGRQLGSGQRHRPVAR